MLPQHDDLEFDADVVSILPQDGTRLPGPVLAWGRQLLANQLIRGDGEAHGTFHLNYGTTSWDVTIRQEPWGGHKIIFRESGCLDRFPGYTAFNSSLAPTGYFGFYRDGTKEEIDPLDGQPRPLGDPATTKRTKGYRLPDDLRLETPHSPDVLLRTASMYTGQMREAVQCIHQRGSHSPFDYRYNPRTHGIVEAPHPRVVGGDASEEGTNHGQRKFWLVEISMSGVFATRVRNTKRCCDSWLPKWAVKSEAGDYTFTPLSTKFAEVGQTVVTRLLTAAQVAPAYDSSVGGPVTSLPVTGLGDVDAWTGWAFSYSGHQAQLVTLSSVTGTVRAYRFRIDFTALAGATPSISATFTTVENAVPLPSISFVVPRRTLGAFPQKTTVGLSGTGVTNYDAPLYVYYSGDSERILRTIATSAAVSIPTVFPSFPGGSTLVPTGGIAIQYLCTTAQEYASSTPIEGTDGSSGTAGTRQLVLTGAFTMGGDEHTLTGVTQFSGITSGSCSSTLPSATEVCPKPFGIPVLQEPNFACGSPIPPGYGGVIGTILSTRNTTWWVYDRVNGSLFKAHTFEITLPYIDREAVLIRHVENNHDMTNTTTNIIVGGQTHTTIDTSGVSYVSGPPTCTNLGPAPGGGTNAGSVSFFGAPTHPACPTPPSTSTGLIPTGTGTTVTMRLAIRSENVLVGVSNVPTGVVANHRVMDAPYVMGAGLFYADPTKVIPPNAADKLLLKYDQPFPYTPNFDTLFPTDTIVPTGFLKPDIYPGGWIGRI